MFQKTVPYTIVWFLLFVTSVCLADVDSAPYLRFGAGARSVGMAGASTAVADGASSTVLNPAGLTNVDGLAFTLATQRLSFDRNHSFVGVAKNLTPQSAIGLAITSFEVAGIKEVTNAGEEKGTFPYGSGAYTLSYGHALEQVNLGVSLRVISDKFGLDSDSRQTGLGGLDLGVLGKLYSNTVFYGATLKNLGGSTASALDLGVAFRYGGKNAVTVALDLGTEFANIEESTTAVKLGLEYILANMFAIRGGTQRSANRTSLYVGFGVNVANFDVNYAIKPVDSTDFDVVGDANTHYVSLSYSY